MTETADEIADRSSSPPVSSDSALLSRRRVLASITAASLGTGVAGGRVGGRQGTTDGLAALGADESGRGHDEAWVETDVDTNDSGQPDRVYVRVSRPEATAEGEQLPVIATASPYFGDVTHSDATPEMKYDRAVEPVASEEAGGHTAVAGPRRGRDGPGGANPRDAPAHRASLAAEGIPQQRGAREGYVLARVSALGTHRSTGCYTAAGPPTIEALEAVVDWFNGRGTAYASAEGETTVDADWTNGRTGFIGASAEGELANGLATTGVDGLEAVVPQAANNGQFSLFRANGTPISVVREAGDRMADLGSWIQASNARRSDCDHWTEIVEDGQDRETGDYNDFWHEREFLTDAGDVDAGVLLTHAVDDLTVTPNNVADWYDVLDGADAPVKLWLHTGGHTAPRGPAWNHLLDRWWAYWLKDEDNGVMDEDPVSIVHSGPNATQEAVDTYESWPVPETQLTTLQCTPGGQTAGGLTVDDAGAGDGGRASDGPDQTASPDSDEETEQAAESLVDEPSIPASELVAAHESDHRLRYETAPLSASVHVSGRVVPSFALSFDEPTVVSAALVEVRDDGSEIVTRGWADPLNRPSYSEFDSPVAYKESLRESKPIDPGEQVRVEFPLQATDYVFESGSRISLVVYASDRAFTLHPPGNATVTLSLADSSVIVPVVGGREALASAFGTDSGDQSGASGPGFGVGAAIGALGSAGYLLKRRVTGDE